MVKSNHLKSKIGDGFYVMKAIAIFFDQNVLFEIQLHIRFKRFSYQYISKIDRTKYYFTLPCLIITF